MKIITVDRATVEQALEALSSAAVSLEESRDYPITTDEVVEAQEKLHAALQQPAIEPVPVPHGWKLVPIEPTPEMASAGHYRYCAEFVRDYKRTLAAAPVAQSAKPLTDAQIAEAGQVEADAARWRFWRSLYADHGDVRYEDAAHHIERALTPEQLDAAVDAAIKELL